MASVFGVVLPEGVDWGVCVRDAATGEVLAEHEPDRGIRLRHKTGTDHGVRADAGLIDGPERSLAYAVLARFDDARRDEVLAVMRELGRQAGSATQAVPSRSKPSRP